MTPQAVLPGKLRGGRVLLPAGALARATEGWRDGDVVVVVRPHANPRSLAANAFLWGVVYRAIADHTGYTPEEIHSLMKTLHLPKHVAIANQHGEVVEDRVIGGSTARLSTSDFRDYITRVSQWAVTTLGLVIPDPHAPAR